MNATHETLLDMIRHRLKIDGTDALSNKISSMRKADKMYGLYRQLDTDDKKAVEKGEPVKIIVPVTYAQIQTAMAVVMAILNKSPSL